MYVKLLGECVVYSESMFEKAVDQSAPLYLQTCNIRGEYVGGVESHVTESATAHSIHLPPAQSESYSCLVITEDVSGQ